jgi:hypothetical protein
MAKVRSRKKTKSRKKRSGGKGRHFSAAHRAKLSRAAKARWRKLSKKARASRVRKMVAGRRKKSRGKGRHKR